MNTRKRNRLKDHDYSQCGMYSITICTKDRKKMFGHIVTDAADTAGLNAVGANCVRPDVSCVRPDVSNNIKASHSIVLSGIGEIIAEEIARFSEIYKNVVVDRYVIMPDHIHIIIVIVDNGRTHIIGEHGRTQFAPTVRPPTISRIIKQLKGIVTKKIGYSIWQKSFYDHIIRTQDNYNQTAEYIKNNPEMWNGNCFYE